MTLAKRYLALAGTVKCYLYAAVRLNFQYSSTSHHTMSDSMDKKRKTAPLRGSISPDRAGQGPSSRSKSGKDDQHNSPRATLSRDQAKSSSSKIPQSPTAPNSIRMGRASQRDSNESLADEYRYPRDTHPRRRSPSIPTSPVSEWHHERRRSLLAQPPSPIRETNEDGAFSALGASISDLRTSDLVSDSTAPHQPHGTGRSRGPYFVHNGRHRVNSSDGNVEAAPPRRNKPHNQGPTN